jgi:soluble lytic murein transglycosylase-like protein
LKKLFLLLFLVIFGLSFAGLAEADFWPYNLQSTGNLKTNAPISPKIKPFIASPEKSPTQMGKYDPWPKNPPQIGRLVLKPEYWNYMKEAARKYQISPYLIQAVCAIESRYDPNATSGHGQCYGLMQLHNGTAKKYGVDSRDPRQNIMGGAAVLANLLTRYNGDLSRVLHVYNATCTTAYEREVKKAYYQAMRSGLVAAQLVSYHR